MHGTTQLCHPVSRKMLKLVRMWGEHSEDSELSCFLGTDYNAQRSDKRHPVNKPQCRKRDNRAASDGINATTPPTIHISVASSSAHSSVGYRRIPLRLICPTLIRALPLHSKRLQPTLNISNSENAGLALLWGCIQIPIFRCWLLRSDSAPHQELVLFSPNSNRLLYPAGVMSWDYLLVLYDLKMGDCWGWLDGAELKSTYGSSGKPRLGF